MGKDNMDSTFDFDGDSEFSVNFYKNIEKVLGDSGVEANESSMSNEIKETGEKYETESDLNDTTEERSETTEEEELENVEASDDEASDDEAEGAEAVYAEAEATETESTEAVFAEAEANEAESTEANDSEAEGIEAEDTEAENTEAEASDAEQASDENSVEELKILNEADEEEIAEELVNINSSLARQICTEMEEMAASQAQKQKRYRFLKIQSGVLLTLLCLAGFGFFLGFTKPGHKILLNMGVNISGKIWTTFTNDFEDITQVSADVDVLEEEDIESDDVEVDETEIVFNDHPGAGRQEEGVYNILLIGEEAIGSGSARGRTDVIVIATMNTNNKTLLLTSLMRDTYVQIPNYKGNKLNSAYEKGGVNLLYETISMNFDIHLDGCIKVDFEDFEKIIDKLGGLELTLTKGEARYLNSTNYISNPKYRNVVAGKQLLNGNQVLGYARVRKRATITGNNNDYGRTDRHRIILNAIFDKYKTKSKAELATLMFEFLPMITTDIDDKCFEQLLNAFIEMGTTEISQLRIPADGTFSDNVKVRGMDVLIPDYEANIEILHEAIFGDTSAENAEGNKETNGTYANIDKSEGSTDSSTDDN